MGLLIGLVIGGVALVGALIWAVVDNIFIYKRKTQAQTEPETPDPS